MSNETQTQTGLIKTNVLDPQWHFQDDGPKARYREVAMWLEGGATRTFNVLKKHALPQVLAWLGEVLLVQLAAEQAKTKAALLRPVREELAEKQNRLSGLYVALEAAQEKLRPVAEEYRQNQKVFDLLASGITREELAAELQRYQGSRSILDRLDVQLAPLRQERDRLQAAINSTESDISTLAEMVRQGEEIIASLRNREISQEARQFIRRLLEVAQEERDDG